MMANKRPTWLIVLLVSIALVPLAYLLGRRSTPPVSQRAGAAASDDGQRLAALEREIQGLRAATVRATLASQEAIAERTTTAAITPEQARGKATPGDDDTLKERLDPEEEARRGDTERAAFLADLSRRVDTEPVDGAWRHDTETGIRRLIAEHLGPKVSISEATCASSVCRVKLNHPEWPHIPTEKMIQFDVNRSSLAASQIQFDPSAERATTLYFMRDQPTATAQP
jgi:hypothetical protein